MSEEREYDLKGTHLVICVPVYDGKIPVEVLCSIMNTMAECRRHAVHFTLEYRAGSALIEKARSELMHTFLHHTPGTHMLFVDSDVAWEPSDAIRLLAFCTEVDAVAGPYCTKEVEPTFHYGLDQDGDGKVIQDERGLLKLKSGPMGFNCFRREALEKMVAAYPELTIVSARGDLKGESISHLFHMGIEPDSNGTPRLLGEDIAFYKRWEQCGLEAWLDPAIQLQHLGKAAYTKDYDQYVREKSRQLQAGLSDAA